MSTHTIRMTNFACDSAAAAKMKLTVNDLYLIDFITSCIGTRKGDYLVEVIGFTLPSNCIAADLPIAFKCDRDVEKSIRNLLRAKVISRATEKGRFRMNWENFYRLIGREDLNGV